VERQRADLLPAGIFRVRLRQLPTGGVDVRIGEDTDDEQRRREERGCDESDPPEGKRRAQ
jgi:hypothetical protein